MPTVNDDYPKNTKMTDEEMKAAAIAQYESKHSDVKSHNFPTEIIELPSKGIPYPAGHPLKSGTIEMKYMTAKEEDILTNQSFIKQGVVLDKLFKSLIVTNVPYDDLLLGDKNAIMLSARILGYGKHYETKIQTPSGNEQSVVIDLTELTEKEVDFDLLKDGQMEYEYELPISKRKIKVRLLDQHAQNKIDAEIRGLKKVNKTASPDLSTRMKHIITSVGGDTDVKLIRDFVDNYLLARDSRALREYIREFQPDIDMNVTITSGGEDMVIELPLGVNFFFPDA